MEEEEKNVKVIEVGEIKEEQAKKKKKKTKNKKKKTVEPPQAEEPREEEEKKESTSAENHEDLLNLLSQNDNSLFEKLLNATPDFTNFDDINKKFQEQIKKMDETINAIFSGNYEKIADEEENYGYKGMPDEKNIDPKRKNAMKELKEKIDFFKEKIAKLDDIQKTKNEELNNEEKEMINSIRVNLLDDIKRAEDFMLVIANTDSYILKH